MTINVLIIDDNENNINEIGEALTQLDNNIKYYPTTKNKEDIAFVEKVSTFINNESIIDLANYIRDKILTEDIDIVILDLALAQAEENLPVFKTSGIILMKTLLKFNVEILEYMPFFVYSAMNINEIKENTKTNIIYSSKKPDVVTVDNIKDDFKKNGNEKLNILINQASKYKRVKERYYRYDILVVCALQEELDYILRLPLMQGDNYKKEIRDAREYHFSKFENGKKVVAITEDTMGMSEAATLTTRAIDMFSPKYVVMTGIAAGVKPDEQNPLDILMPTHVYNWQAGKYYMWDGQDAFDRDFRSYPTCRYHLTFNNLKDRVNNFLKEEGLDSKDQIGSFIGSLDDKSENELSFFQEELKKIESDKGNEKAKSILKEMYEDFNVNIYRDGMVSGSAVVANSNIIENMVKQRKVHGLDMEAYGVVLACVNHPINPKAIIIKSICDFAGEDKGDIYHAPASYISAQVFYEMFNEELINKW